VNATIANIPRVKAKLRDYLRAHGLDVPKMTIAAPVWGTAARRAAWRATVHMQSHGKAIAQSAKYTQRLVDALFPLSFVDRQQRILAREVGVKEHPAGSNDGPRIREYQRAGGIPHPENLRAEDKAWCACFATWADIEAGFPRASLPSNPAGVPSWAACRNAHITTVSKLAARRGDHLCLFGNGHIETITHVIVPGLVWATIGGNTSVSGSQSNGGMVCRKTRYARDVSAVKRVRP